MISRPLATLSLAATLTLGLAATASAHAIVVASTPAAHARVSGPDLPVEIRFNSKIDAARSRLTLIGPGGAKIEVGLKTSNSAQTLTGAASGLAPGDYRLLWQTLSVDGHISHGEIPFEVDR